MAKKQKAKPKTSTNVTFRADDGLLAKLNALAESEDRKLADVVRRLVKRGLEVGL